jgi:hypothetical protein
MLVVRRPIAFAALMLSASCGDDSHSSVRTCVPEGPWTWPADCDLAQCHMRTCDTTCPEGQTCTELDCTQSSQCRLECQNAATCPNVDCTGADVCFVSCLDASVCEIHGGDNALSLNIDCLGASQCLLHCGNTPVEKCHYAYCDSGPVMDCGNGTYACNRPCP